MQRFSERLRIALDRAGISQEDLSRRLLMNESTVSRWFTEGWEPQPRALDAIANATGVRKEWLLAGTGEMAAWTKRSRISVQSSREIVARRSEKPPESDVLRYIKENGTPEQIEAVETVLSTMKREIEVRKQKETNESDNA